MPFHFASNPSSSSSAETDRISAKRTSNFRVSAGLRSSVGIVATVEHRASPQPTNRPTWIDWRTRHEQAASNTTRAGRGRMSNNGRAAFSGSLVRAPTYQSNEWARRTVAGTANVCCRYEKPVLNVDGFCVPVATRRIAPFICHGHVGVNPVDGCARGATGAAVPVIIASTLEN